METKLNFSQIPKTTKIYLDYLYDFEKVKPFYSHLPYNDSHYHNLFQKLTQRPYNRELLAHVLKEQNRKYNNQELTISSIEQIRSPKTLVIFTGQQVGLFTGPLYTIYKAMTAINLARYFTMTTPYTFLPLFWVEGEDHDFEEVRSAKIIHQRGHLTELRYDPKEPFDGKPVGSLILDEGINNLIEEFTQSTVDTEYRSAILELLRETYHPGTTMADAFASLLARILGPYGLILVDPSDSRLKKASLPVYKQSLEDHETKIIPALEKTGTNLKNAGYHIQVEHKPDTLNFFYHEPRRLPLVHTAENYTLRGTDRTFTKEELTTLLENEIENFSPNVILRPQVQDYLFPTAAYVAGPSEIAYFAQFGELYHIFETPMPIIYPRKSLTLVEPGINRIMNKYGISPEEIFADWETLEKRILLANVPENLRNIVEDTRTQIFNLLDSLEHDAVNFSADLRGISGRMKGKIGKELSTFEFKITREVEKKDITIKDQLRRIRTNLTPDGTLQERTLNILNYLNKYHLKFIYNLMELTCCKHEKSHLIWRIDV